MTSEVFVYITLPGRTEAVTAGKFRLETSDADVALGSFVYGKSYLARSDRVEIDPVELRLGSGQKNTTRLGGVFGALRDASPDHWGRLVIERELGRPELGEVDYLLHSPDDRAGALGFGLNQVPPAPRREFNRTLDLARLHRIADRIVADEREADEGPDANRVRELLLIGTSMGGARPKAVVEDDRGLHLAKFSRADDRWNDPRVEHAMLTLAHECGLACAESRVETVGGRDVLLVRRFDRERADGGYLRHRMVSALTVLRADGTRDARDTWSYLLLADEVRRLTAAPRDNLAELFRRMCFNALISNLDDHPRNHALLARSSRGWTLSPAYDLTPRPAVSLERRDLALQVGRLGRWANRDNLVSDHGRFLLDRTHAEAIVDDMAAQVGATWYRTARTCGVSERDCERIRDAFVYEGFGYRPPARDGAHVAQPTAFPKA